MTLRPETDELAQVIHDTLADESEDQAEDTQPLAPPALVDHVRRLDELSLGDVLTDLDRAVLTGIMQQADGSVDLYLNGSREPTNRPGGTMLAVEELQSKPDVAARVALARIVEEAEELAARELAIQEARASERAALEPHRSLPAGQPADETPEEDGDE